MSTPHNKILVDTLVEYGLNDKEAKIYITLLEFEIATVNQLAEESGINRSSAYVVLDMLMKKGLVSISDEKNVRQYVATPPAALLKAAEEIVAKQTQVKNNIASIIPDLKALYKGTKQKPIVRVFEGKDGIINLFEDTLSAKEKNIRVVSNLQNLVNIIPQDYFPQYVQDRMKLHLKMYGIHPLNKVSEFIQQHAPKTIDEQVFIPEASFTSPSDIAIYDNKVGFMSSKNGGTGILIESDEMAEVMKNMFDLAFSGAKALHQNNGVTQNSKRAKRK